MKANELKATDLMVGDWLMFYDKPCQVKGLHDDDTVTLTGYRSMYYLIDAEPILLTSEILEKNADFYRDEKYYNYYDFIKEIDIYHYPQEDLSSKIVVSISTDGENWEELQLINQVSVYVRATMPATGDYYLQIKSKSKNFYIHQIEYTTEKCACFPYIKPE